MEEQETHQHTADVKEGETQSMNKVCFSASNEHKQNGTDIAVGVKQSEASSSASTSRENNSSSVEDMEPPDIKNSPSATEEIILLENACSSSDEARTLTMEDDSTSPQTDDRSHCDCNRKTREKEQLTVIGEKISEEHHTGEKKAPKSTAQTTLDDRRDDHVDGPRDSLVEETTGTDNRDTETGGDDGIGLNIQESTNSMPTALLQRISNEKEICEQRSEIEIIGPTTQETTKHAAPVVTGSPGGRRKYLLTVGIMVVVAILVQYLLQPESPPQKEDVQQIVIFRRLMENLKTQFPNQRAELWNRSKIHLLRHLQTAQPTEPVSLMLTAGIRAEQTLRCLAQGLASTFSSALNASVLHIDGASKANQDSDRVKLDIDNKLQIAFEGDKPVAVIHRFEELPPGSTLIFYRYCDHENAAYKKTFLLFTVLLGEEQEIPAKSRLSTVEEMVDDHLQKKFLSDGHPISFDRMDRDKYGGLWSRISHLILPVMAEERLEHEGCSGT